MVNSGDHRSYKDELLDRFFYSLSLNQQDSEKSVKADKLSKSPCAEPIYDELPSTLSPLPEPGESSKSLCQTPLIIHRPLSYPNFASSSSSSHKSLLLNSLQGSYDTGKNGFGSIYDEHGESSKISSAPPLYSDYLNPFYDEPRSPLIVHGPLSYPQKMQYSYDHNFASSSSSPHNNFLHKPLQGSYGDSKLPGFGCTLSIKDNNTLPNTAPFNPIPFPRSGISEVDCPFTLELIQTPSSLCSVACNKPETIESLINSLANSELLLGILVDSLSKKLVKLACNSKGRRVILYCFTNLNPSCILALSDKMAQNCLDLATDRLGCILLNDCIPLMVRSYREFTLFTICNQAHLLASHCYGTYVVQKVVSAEYVHFTPWIVTQIMPFFPVLSTQKEGSHLVEKCIESNSTRAITVKALVELKPEQLQQISCHEFGNFVIQKALIRVKESPKFRELNSKLRAALLPLVKDLKLNKFGRNVASKLHNGRK